MSEEKKQYSMEEFAQEYQLLCQKMGYRIAVKPVFIPRDDGTWSIVLQTSVEQLTKK